MNLKKFIAVIFLCFAVNFGYSQTGVFGTLRLKTRTVTSISNDSTLSRKDSLALITEWAVYNYIKNKFPNGQYILNTEKAATNGVATLDGGGKVPISQLPAITINNTFVVTDSTSMLALDAQVGDVAIRVDANKSYILQSLPASSGDNWIQILAPLTGTTDQLAEGSVNYYFTALRAIAALTGQNISIFTNDANYTNRQELIDSSNAIKNIILSGYYTKMQADSINNGVVHKIGTEILGAGIKTFTDSVRVLTPNVYDSSKSAANTEWVKKQLYGVSGTGTDSSAYYALEQFSDSSYLGIQNLKGKVDTIEIVADGYNSGSLDLSILADSTNAIRNDFPTGAETVLQTVTAGSSVVINNATTWLIVNPTTVLSSMTINLPANPSDGKIVTISFGGTIKNAGSTVVNNVTITPGAGQTLVGDGNLGSVTTDDNLSFKYSNLKWYKN